MKIGLIADIHADIDSLKTALKRLRDVHQVDDILCAGDIAGRGKDEDSVVALMRSLKDEIPVVKGNHDSPTAETTPENADFLRQLPLHYTATIEDVRIFMCHGRPGIPFFGYSEDYLEDDELSELLTEQNADIIIVAHTHTPMFMTVPEGSIINPGALCKPHHHYGILHLPEKRFDLHSLLDEAEIIQQTWQG